MKTPLLKFVILALIIVSLSSCGNKGDLYMPDKDKTEQSN